MTAPAAQAVATLPVHSLRSYTHGVHQRLHHHPMLGLMVTSDVTQQVYQWFLEKHYGFYRGCQAASEAPPDWLAPYVTPAVDWLQEDLLALGVTPARLPTCGTVPMPACKSQWLGFLYVKEGSLLGGQLMLKNLRANLPQASCAQRYLSAHGDDNRRRWRELCLVLNEHLHADLPKAQQSALQTFTNLETWLG